MVTSLLKTYLPIFVKRTVDMIDGIGDSLGCTWDKKAINDAWIWYFLRVIVLVLIASSERRM